MKEFSHIHRWLELPQTIGLDLDDPRTTELRRQIIQEKPLLRRVYIEWYNFFLRKLPKGKGRVLELGAGAGFLRTLIPDVICSDIMSLRNVDVVCSGQAIPFKNNSLKAIVMLNVLHHLPNAAVFFEEALRCLRPGGRILLVEPWMSSLGKFVYSRIHHEPCEPNAKGWEFPSSGPLSGANAALPWIILKRDLLLFKEKYPSFSIINVQAEINMLYFLSGGISMRAILPSFMMRTIIAIEQIIELIAPIKFSLFCRIVLEKYLENEN